MRCSALRGVVVALALLSVPMLGCQIKTIQIQLPGFADGAIDGIFLWKQLPGTNGELRWTRVCRIDFTDLGSSNGSFLNEQPFRNGRINSGDTLRLGRTTKIFFNFK